MTLEKGELTLLLEMIKAIECLLKLEEQGLPMKQYIEEPEAFLKLQHHPNNTIREKCQEIMAVYFDDEEDSSFEIESPKAGEQDIFTYVIQSPVLRKNSRSQEFDFSSLSASTTCSSGQKYNFRIWSNIRYQYNIGTDVII